MSGTWTDDLEGLGIEALADDEGKVQLRVHPSVLKVLKGDHWKKVEHAQWGDAHVISIKMEQGFESFSLVRPDGQCYK